MKDKSDLILIMSDVVPFIESEGDSEIKNRYYEYIALVVNELEVQLKKEETVISWIDCMKKSQQYLYKL
ncbi:hypothetical protein ACT7DD_28175 [Bacillus paranthracis]